MLTDMKWQSMYLRRSSLKGEQQHTQSKIPQRPQNPRKLLPGKVLKECYYWIETSREIIDKVKSIFHKHCIRARRTTLQSQAKNTTNDNPHRNKRLSSRPTG